MATQFLRDLDLGNSFVPSADVSSGAFKVITVDSSIGSEYKAVILWWVRSNKGGSVGFLADPVDGKKRRNVGISRAQDILINIWDSETFLNSTDPEIRRWAKHNVGVFDRAQRLGGAGRAEVRNFKANKGVIPVQTGIQLDSRFRGNDSKQKGDRQSLNLSHMPVPFFGKLGTLNSELGTQFRSEARTATVPLVHFIREKNQGSQTVYLTSTKYSVGTGAWQNLPENISSAMRLLLRHNRNVRVIQVSPELTEHSLTAAFERAAGPLENDFRNDRFEIRTRHFDDLPPGLEHLRANGQLRKGHIKLLEISPLRVRIETDRSLVLTDQAFRELTARAQAYGPDIRAKLVTLLEGRSSETPKFADLNPLRDFPLGSGTKGFLRVVYYVSPGSKHIYILSVSEKKNETTLKDHEKLQSIAQAIRRTPDKTNLISGGKFLGTYPVQTEAATREFLEQGLGLVVSAPEEAVLEEVRLEPEPLANEPSTDELRSMFTGAMETLQFIAEHLGMGLPRLMAEWGKGIIEKSAKPAARPKPVKKTYALDMSQGYLPQEYKEWLAGIRSAQPEMAVTVNQRGLEDVAYVLKIQRGEEESISPVRFSGLAKYRHLEYYLVPFYDADTNSFGLQIYVPRNGSALLGEDSPAVAQNLSVSEVKKNADSVGAIVIRKMGKLSEQPEEWSMAIASTTTEKDTPAKRTASTAERKPKDYAQLKGDVFERLVALVFHPVSQGRFDYDGFVAADPLLSEYRAPDYIWNRGIYDAKLGSDIADIGQAIIKYTLLKELHPDLFDPAQPVTLIVLNGEELEDFSLPGYVKGKDYRFVEINQFLAEVLPEDAVVSSWSRKELVGQFERLRINELTVPALDEWRKKLGEKIHAESIVTRKTVKSKLTTQELHGFLRTQPETVRDFVRSTKNRVAEHTKQTKARYINEQYVRLVKRLVGLRGAIPDGEWIRANLPEHEKIFDEIRGLIEEALLLLKEILPREIYPEEETRTLAMRRRVAQAPRSGVDVPVLPESIAEPIAPSVAASGAETIIEAEEAEPEAPATPVIASSPEANEAILEQGLPRQPADSRLAMTPETTLPAAVSHILPKIDLSPFQPSGHLDPALGVELSRGFFIMNDEVNTALTNLGIFKKTRLYENRNLSQREYHQFLVALNDLSPVTHAQYFKNIGQNTESGRNKLNQALKSGRERILFAETMVRGQPQFLEQSLQKFSRGLAFFEVVRRRSVGPLFKALGQESLYAKIRKGRFLSLSEWESLQLSVGSARADNPNVDPALHVQLEVFVEEIEAVARAINELAVANYDQYTRTVAASSGETTPVLPQSGPLGPEPVSETPADGPNMGQGGRVIGKIDPALADRWGFPRDVKVFEMGPGSFMQDPRDELEAETRRKGGAVIQDPRGLRLHIPAESMTSSGIPEAAQGPREKQI